MIKNLQTLGFILAILAGAVLFIGLFNDSAVSYSEDSDDLNRGYWEERIAQAGPADMYQEFLKKNALAPFDLRHVSAHVVGELFYGSEGAEGIQYCDSSFGFGCFHGFFTRAVSEKGLAVVRNLDEACVGTYGTLGTGCQHGIGHGIMEYLGYADVNEALNACGDTTQVVPLLGCTSGVFMEYRKPLTIDGESAEVVPRPFDASDPYMPCDRIEDRFRLSCYFELGDWWYSTIGPDYSRMGTLCRNAPSAYRKACFIGVGSIIAPRETYDVSKSLHQCNLVGDSPVEVRYCKSGAAWSFYANPDFRDRYRVLCSGVSKEDEMTCLTDSDLTEGLEGRTL